MLKIILILALAVILVACVKAKSSQGSDAVKVVSPAEFKTSLETDSTAFLLDVRTPGEYAEAQLKGATLLDWKNESSFQEGAKALDKSKTIYVYCRSGRRSNAAAHYLAEQGYTVVDMDGGIMAWQGNGLPTE